MDQWKNLGSSSVFPKFPGSPSCEEILVALFDTLRQFYKSEQSELIKFNHRISVKALKPSNLEKQNVKCALQVLNIFAAETLKLRWLELQIVNACDSAEFMQ